MNLSELKKNIKTSIVGRDILYFDELESTNSYLYESALENDYKDGTVLISDSQSKGKGRLKRTWISPKGANLYMSLLLRPGIKPEHASIFTFLASCALKDTFDHYGVDCEIKWPNDILVENKKIAGVLTELRYSANKVKYIIIGIGVNINMSRDFIRKSMSSIHGKVTSMECELGASVERELFSAELINNIERFYLKFLNHGNKAILSDWTKRWHSKGKKIEVRDGNKIYKGVADSVDENGFLYIRNANGDLVKVVTGDIIF